MQPSKRKAYSIMFLFGFSSGLPLALIGTTLQAWFTVEHASFKTVGAISLIGIPYLFKFLWAPIFDSKAIGSLGRYRGWMLIFQCLLIVMLCAMSLTSPNENPWALGCIALVTAFISATQDVLVDGYRTQWLPEELLSRGTSVFVMSYRVAMLVSGGGAMILADHIGWMWTYRIMSLFVIAGIVGVWAAPKLTHHNTPIARALIHPIKQLCQIEQPALLFLFIALYKLPDVGALALNGPFLLSLGLSLSTVGTLNKVIGIGATFVGTAIAGWSLYYLGYLRGLLYFGILQIMSNAGFLLLALVGPNMILVTASVILDNLALGMASVALTTFIMHLCDKQWSATQFALLSAVAGFARVLITPVAGWLVDSTGWATFYIWSMILGIPALSILVFGKGMKRLTRTMVVQ